jgi:ABC-type antimicrobial peptide transport system permease subunit
MNAASLTFASVRYYWRTHLGVVLGTALAATVLIGSLLVGDSVEGTLKRQALQRVGKIDVALTAGDRFFRSQLASEVDPNAAPVLVVRGSVSRTDGTARINGAQVLGVEDRFWKLAPTDTLVLTGEDIALNQRAAGQLGVKAGDPVVLRIEKPGAFSRDAPLSGEENEVLSIRATIGRIVGDDEFGRFSLAASQVPPPSVFVPLAYLQKRLEFSDRANLLVARGSIDILRTEIQQRWTITDAGLKLLDLPNGAGTELRSERVFLSDTEVKAAPRGLESLTYLVNELRASDRATPYSMVTAIDAPSSGFLPAELDDDEIVVSQWLAEDLGVKLNDRISLKYFTMGERRQLVEQSREFEIIQILPMSEPALNTSWMPDFPGLSDQENCRDWKPGFAIDNTKIRDKDEAYWKEYRGTPKAFVNLNIGQQMWGNRWGNVTSIRFGPSQLSGAISSVMRETLTPEKIGFQLQPLRSQALKATDAPIDFGQYFLYFSFFLIVAAAVLTGLLFVFTLEQRNVEAGTLLALGLPEKTVRHMLLSEGVVLAVIGAVLGCVGAVAFTRLVLKALTTVWRSAVGAVEFSFSASPLSLIGGSLGSIAVAFLAMWLASRRQLRRQASELLSGESSSAGVAQYGKQRGRRPSASVVTILATVVALALAAFGKGNAGAFFGAGALLLIAGISLSARLLRGEDDGQVMDSVDGLARRNTSRRLGRSLATIGILACGVFMVVSVSSFRKSPETFTSRRDTGTGGFALVAESALPIYEDLNSPTGRETYAIDETAVRSVSVVPMRVRDGDDASCLNLNRALQPRILAVKPSELAERKAFRFSSKGASWALLEQVESAGAVPGIVDANTLKYAMQKKLGDTVDYQDEQGRLFGVRVVATIVGSMLQGNVIVAEKAFIDRFPSAGGYRFFLIDAAPAGAKEAAEELSRALQDRGLEIVPASQRLDEFNAVENTYLSIFQALGGLGLLLGTAGLAIVVARNVLERRREFGLLEAVGFNHGNVRRLVFAEHRWLIVLGLLSGAISALFAVFPQLQGKTGGFPYVEFGLLFAALAIGCVLWTWLATRVALRGSQLPALRNE